MGSTCHTKREHLPRKRMLSFGQCLNTWGVCPNFDHVIVPKIDKLLTFMFVCFLVIITIIIIISSGGICRSPTELSIMATISESPSNGIKSPPPSLKDSSLGCTWAAPCFYYQVFDNINLHVFYDACQKQNIVQTMHFKRDAHRPPLIWGALHAG